MLTDEQYAEILRRVERELLDLQRELTGEQSVEGVAVPGWIERLELAKRALK